MKSGKTFALLMALFVCLCTFTPAFAQWGSPYVNSVYVNPYRPMPFYNNYGWRGYNPYWHGGWHHHHDWGYWHPHHGHRYW